jgi:GTP-binding protein EngB required for normal cell division
MKKTDEKRFSGKGKFEIVLAGRSNVGKSALVRELTGRKVRTGKRPGVTLQPTVVRNGDLVVTDLPGFGFMSGVKERKQDIVKDQVVRYFEQHAREISVALLVLDASVFTDITERWAKKGEIPIDIEMFDFLGELGVDTIIVPNKMDRVKNRDKELDSIVSGFGLLGSWKRWESMITPVCAKTGDIAALKILLRERLHAARRDDLLKYL